MIGRGRVSLRSATRYGALYLVLVGYSLAYVHFYEYQLTPLINNAFTAYDPSRDGIYTAICFLTPLAILPIGTRLRAAGQFITGVLAVLLFIPIPIVFVPMPTVGEYWTIYWLLWTGYLIVSSLSSLDVNIGLTQLTDAGFRRLLTVTFAIVGLCLAYLLVTNHVQFVFLSAAEAARADVTVTGLQGYLVPSYMYSLGGLLIAAAVAYRRYFLILPALAGFLVCYVVIEERAAALMPVWLAFIYFSQKYVFRDSVIRYLLCVMTPFLVLTFCASLFGTSDRQSLFYEVFMLAVYRTYSVSAISFNVYYNFFHFNPYTYWSHITFISKFVNNPYGQPLAVTMMGAYKLGNYNASFLETDGLAAAGTAALPGICALFGVVLVAVNSCTRRLGVRMLALVMAGSSIALVDVGLGPGLLSDGLGLLCLVLLFAPRQASWTDADQRPRQLRADSSITMRL